MLGVLCLEVENRCTVLPLIHGIIFSKMPSPVLEVHFTSSTSDALYTPLMHMILSPMPRPAAAAGQSALVHALQSKGGVHSQRPPTMLATNGTAGSALSLPNLGSTSILRQRVSSTRTRTLFHTVNTPSAPHDIGTHTTSCIVL